MRVESKLYLDSMISKYVKRNNETVSGWQRHRSRNFVILATQTLACGWGKSRSVSTRNRCANQSNSTFIRLEGDFKTCHFLLEEVAFLVSSRKKILGQQWERYGDEFASLFTVPWANIASIRQTIFKIFLNV